MSRRRDRSATSGGRAKLAGRSRLCRERIATGTRLASVGREQIPVGFEPVSVASQAVRVDPETVRVELGTVPVAP